MRGHMTELREITSEMNLVWLGIGFHPLARQEDLSWVPKQRYSIMKRYLPTKGSRAHDMMRRTATVQSNLDYSDEDDGMRKLRVALVLAPIANAMFANSPFYEGKLAGKKSVRGEVWLDMDPERSGLMPALWKKERLTYRDYAEWALDAGMFLIKRQGQAIANTGQSFRSFLRDGYQGHRATLADWKLHLNTLFPEARIKGTLEVRACDSLPTDLACAVSALYTGLLYDPQALDQAEALCFGLSFDDIQPARPALVKEGLGARIGSRSARDLALRILEIASGGLERRARLNAQGQDERIHLKKLVELNEAGLSPADRLTEGLSDDDPDFVREILARARL
jgi:glutamate--cysteine ligase